MIVFSYFVFFVASYVIASASINMAILLFALRSMFTNLMNLICVAAGALITAYFTPIIGLLACCFTASTVDMFYGIAVAKK